MFLAGLIQIRKESSQEHANPLTYNPFLLSHLFSRSFRGTYEAFDSFDDRKRERIDNMGLIGILLANIDSTLNHTWYTSIRELMRHTGEQLKTFKHAVEENSTLRNLEQLAEAEPQGPTSQYAQTASQGIYELLNLYDVLKDINWSFSYRRSKQTDFGTTVLDETVTLRNREPVNVISLVSVWYEPVLIYSAELQDERKAEKEVEALTKFLDNPEQSDTRNFNFVGGINIRDIKSSEFKIKSNPDTVWSDTYSVSNKAGKELIYVPFSFNRLEHYMVEGFEDAFQRTREYIASNDLKRLKPVLALSYALFKRVQDLDRYHHQQAA